MFSCCRANPKDSKKSKKINEDNANKKQQQNEQNQENKKSSQNVNRKKLIIPTITIENGKTTEKFSNNEQNMCKNECVNSETDTLNDNISAAIATEAIEISVKETEPDTFEQQATTKTTTTTRTQAIDAEVNAAEFAGTADINVDSANVSQTNDAEIVCSKALQNVNNNLQKTNSIDVGATTSAITPIDSPEKAGGDYISHANDNAEIPLRTHSQSCDTNENIANNEKPKSCLSRHSSTHTSIKKRVNISVHAEIIQTDAFSPTILPLSASIGDEEDDVFSDSMPPPKRESMCAPYVERDINSDDVISETLVYSHGLPEWFNDERINNAGCVEPPVTPVGRDELELKRQRIYKDLLVAAKAAVKHNARFESFITGHSDADRPYRSTQYERWRDCDPDLKPSVAENLEHLVNRLEKLIERLERSISARELEVANRTFDSVLEKKRASFDLETTELPAVPTENLSVTEQTVQLSQRIERIEKSLGKINERHNNHNQLSKDNSVENISTVLEDFSSILLPPPQIELNMSVLGYQHIIDSPLNHFMQLSAKIGGEVAQHAELVKKAFNAQQQYIILATQCSQPNEKKQWELLKPTSDQISAVQDFRTKRRDSEFYNHLLAISESIPALGWVCVTPTPGPHVKEMIDSAQFFINRMLKDWKEKDSTHVQWSCAWVQTLTELQYYIKQYHTTGLVWSGKGAAPESGAIPPPPPMGSCPPPPPPPIFDMSNMNLGEGPDDRSALFAEINQGENITKNLKKVTDDMQTHKNATLRTGPAPFKTPTQFGSTNKTVPVFKEPVFTRDGKKWLIEYQKNNNSLLVENAEMNNVVYMFKCEGSVLTVKGKVNNVVLDSCKKCSLVFDSVVASIEFVNCQSVQMQVLGFVPTISIDKTDGCQMYLCKESLGVEVVSSKSSEMNIMLPEESGDYTELPVPEQFKTTITGKALKTVCVDSLG